MSSENSHVFGTIEYHWDKLEDEVKDYISDLPNSSHIPKVDRHVYCYDEETMCPVCPELKSSFSKTRGYPVMFEFIPAYTSDKSASVSQVFLGFIQAVSIFMLVISFRNSSIFIPTFVVFALVGIFNIWCNLLSVSLNKKLIKCTRDILETTSGTMPIPSMDYFLETQRESNTLTPQIRMELSDKFVGLLEQKILYTDRWWYLLDPKNRMDVLDSISYTSPLKFVVAPWLWIFRDSRIQFLGRLVSYSSLFFLLFSPFLWTLNNSPSSDTYCIIHGCIELFVLLFVSYIDYTKTFRHIKPLMLQYLWTCCFNRLRSMAFIPDEKKFCSLAERKNLFIQYSVFHPSVLYSYFTASLDLIWNHNQ